MNKLLSSAVASSRLGVFSEIISNQFEIDLTKSMVYLVDCVDETALPWLAAQFDVDGYHGYNQCKTVTQKRELIKNAISMHQKIGTISAIRRACTIVGFTPKEIIENIPLVEGGPNVWCAFKVGLNPEDLSSFNSNTLTTLRTFINYYKNARSILKEIYFNQPLEEVIFTSQDREELVLKGTFSENGDYSTDYGYDYY